MPQRDDICDVPGILVGHDTDHEGGTGCTVIRCAWPALGGVDVRGGAPGTRETDLLDPTCMMQEVHAVLLSGGSAFGLAAADGVMRALEAEGAGFDTGVARVPIVPGAVLFDLWLGSPAARPDAAAGERATRAATSGPVAQGSVGAGTGATVGKIAGPRLATKGGVGSASTTVNGVFTVGALVAVNALGDVYDPATGQMIAGARSPDGTGWLAAAPFAAGAMPPAAGTNTTLAVVATDAPCSKAELARLARLAHDGLAQAIRPVHTTFDGDAVFTLSTSQERGPGVGQLALTQLGAAAVAVVVRAILRAVEFATGLHGVPARRDLPFVTAWEP